MHPTVTMIRKWLNELNITYSMASEFTNIEESKMKRILGGRASMTLEERDKLFEMLLTKESEKQGYKLPPLSPMALIEIYRRINERQQRLISDLLVEFDSGHHDN